MRHKKSTAVANRHHVLKSHVRIPRESQKGLRTCASGPQTWRWAWVPKERGALRPPGPQKWFSYPPSDYLSHPFRISHWACIRVVLRSSRYGEEGSAGGTGGAWQRVWGHGEREPGSASSTERLLIASVLHLTLGLHPRGPAPPAILSPARILCTNFSRASLTLLVLSLSLFRCQPQPPRRLHSFLRWTT